jgi:MFS transporter, FSR family, fosmidomycin resistance protein
VLADRMSRKKLLVFGLALNGLGFAALALAPNYAWALVAVAVAGFGGSFYHPAATAMVARLFPSNTGKALGLVGIGAGVGFFVGPLYAGWRASTLEPILGAAAWRRPVLELGILGIIVAAIFAWMADEERPAAASEHKTVPAGKLFPAPALWFFFLAYCFAFSVRDFAGSSMSSLSSLFLQKAHGYDPKWTGLALSGIFVAAVISNPLFGILSDGGRKRWITLALLAAALMMVIFPHVPSRWTIPVLIVYGFFFMASYPMTEAALMESVPDAVRGRVFGLFVMGGGVIGNLSHWAVGVKVKHLGDAAHSPNAYFLSYAVIALLALASLAGLFCLPAIQRREGPVAHKPAGDDSMPLLT